MADATVLKVTQAVTQLRVTQQVATILKVGVMGPSGVNGASAYQIAVANGFVGTESAWLASLSAGGIDIFNQILDGGNF